MATRFDVERIECDQVRVAAIEAKHKAIEAAFQAASQLCFYQLARALAEGRDCLSLTGADREHLIEAIVAGLRERARRNQPLWPAIATQMRAK